MNGLGEENVNLTDFDLNDAFSADNLLTLQMLQSAENGTLGQDLQTTVSSTSTSGEESSRTRKRSSNSCAGDRKKIKLTANKETEEYRVRRERNNVFVRACREKARRKHQEVELRFSELAEENKRLSAKVDTLVRELSIMRNLLTSVGASVPAEVAAILQDQDDQ